MKITDVRIRYCETELDSSVRSRGCAGYSAYTETWSKSQSLYIIELFTDTNYTGITLLNENAPHTSNFLEKPIPHYLLGEDPTRIADLLARMLRYRHQLHDEDQNLWRRVVNHIEFALWDLKAKSYDTPLYKYLGGKTNRVRVYAGGATLCWNPLEELVREAADLLKRGFDGFKIKIGHGLERDTEIIRRLREVAGPDTWIAVDANQAYDMENALELLHVLNEEDIAWFEEPVPYDIVDYQILRDKDQTMISAGENFTSLPDAMEAINRRTVDILQCDAGMFSLSDLLAIKHMAMDANIRLTPHCFNNAIGMVMACHLQKSTTPAAQEMETLPSPFVHSIFNEPFEINNGDLLLPDAPGHGYTLNEQLIKDTQVQARELTVI